MYVLEGASFIDEFGYDEELRALAARHPNIRFVPTCSRPDDPRNVGWTGQVGRVHTIVEHYVREWQLEPAETCIYACGHPGMIEDLRGRYAGTRLHVRGRALLEAALDAAARRSRGRVPFRNREDRNERRHRARARCVARCSRIAAAAVAVAADGGGGVTGAAGERLGRRLVLAGRELRGQCVNPRSGTNPADRRAVQRTSGTATDENNWLRSWSNDLYLWYNEIVDRDPALHATPAYFDLLKTTAMTASGAPKDRFHFTYRTTEWLALLQSGTEAGYGVGWSVVASLPPRRIVVAYTDADSPATTANFSAARKSSWSTASMSSTTIRRQASIPSSTASSPSS